MTYCKLAFAALAVLALSAASAQATDEKRAGSSWSLGAHVGSAGPGLTVGFEVLPSFAFRGLAQPGLTISRDMERDGYDYRGRLELQSFGALADWHPFAGTSGAAGGFRLTGGAFINGNALSGKARDPALEIGDRPYDAELNARATFAAVAPYLGVGWAGRLGRSNWAFTADVGAMYTGAPRLSASGHVLRGAGGQCDFSVAGSGTATLTGACPPRLKADLEKEHAELKRTLDKFRWYPVLQLGVVYRF